MPQRSVRLLYAAALLIILATYLGTVAPLVADLHLSDDVLFFVPLVLAAFEHADAGRTLQITLAPASLPWLPAGLWRLYVLGVVRVFGEANAALVAAGVALHVLGSLLVWVLSRCLALPAGVALVAAALHLTAYAGYHAYLWPSGVQHVITVLGMLLVVILYLAAEGRRRAERPWRSVYVLALLATLISSLGRPTSTVVLGAMLAHALLAPGDRLTRGRRLDRWLPVIGLGVLCPLARIIFFGDTEPYRAFPLLGWMFTPFLVLVGPSVTFILALVGLSSAALLLRLVFVFPVLATGVGRLTAAPARRIGLWLLTIALGAPMVAAAIVFLAGSTETLVMPLAAALNTFSGARSHLTALPFDLVGVALAAAAVVLYVRGQRGNPDLIVLLALLGGVAAVLYATGHYPSGHRPSRYMIYLTPPLAIVVASALAEATASLRPRWRRMVLALAAASLALPNLAAIRVDAWRHRMVDGFQVLDYLRVADLVGADLRALRAPRDTVVCIDGLTPPPLDAAAAAQFGYRGSFRSFVATAVVRQALGRRDPASVRLDCGATAPAGARVYQVSGWQVSREGRDLDAFGALWAEMRDAVARRDYHRAVALVAREPDPRPFVVRYLLGSLPDDDVQWATNGASPVPWLERIATTYDVLYEQPDPKVAVLRELVMFELGQYVRYRFFVQYATGRVLLAGQPWDVRGQRLLVLGLTAREVERFAVADPLVERDPAMRALLDAIVSASPVVDDVMVMGAPRTTTSPEFFGFLRRLLFKA